SGRAQSIQFKEPVTDMPDAMRSLDLMVMASEAEPFGLVTVEAMSCGCAVVATRSGASSEIITDDEDGILIEPGSPDAIANAIRGLLKDQDRRNRLGLRARETAVQKFSQGRNIDEIERLFMDLCGLAL
ncbi:MAG: glycosyltransferase family 4 protein, partial [Candidatus Coatesbacteria bacterium]|nr:glycosyltransferase family 4 protein [Candidatus Coatesbacteria bacterium]